MLPRARQQRRPALAGDPLLVFVLAAVIMLFVVR